MAQISGLSAARMIEIQDASIVDARLSGDDLILTNHGGDDINVGSVRGPQGVEGPSGGPPGPAGPANSLSIGTVTTGMPGTNASATISGTAPTQTLNLTIPRGADASPVTLPGAKLRKNASQTYSANVWTKVTFNVVVLDDTGGSMGNLANNRLVIPSNGRYEVGCVLAHTTGYGSDHLKQAALVRGDAQPSAGYVLAQDGTNNASDTSKSKWFTTFGTTDEFTAGEYITLWFQSTAGSNFGAPSPYEFCIWAQKIK